MSQRESGYARIERDAYETPAWVTALLLPHIPDRIQNVWEPACGSGKMVRALSVRFDAVYGTDINADRDFLFERTNDHYDAIITNPPYELATEFINRALALTQGRLGFVAMLLRTDFDHAISRSFLFGKCPQFAKKLVLTKRIRWFEDSRGQPSFNHAWFVWDWQHCGPPILVYGP